MRRPRVNWGNPDDPSLLPAPWAERDMVDIPAGAKALERMPGLEGPGRYRVVYATSIDEGDAWFFRVAKHLTKGPRSDRLHVAFAGRCMWEPESCVDWMEGVTLVRTQDPDGLAQRERMLADGWSFAAPHVCGACRQRIYL